MTGSVSGAQLRAFIERIERLEEEKRTIADDIKEVKAEAKGCGFDLPTINAILKLRKKDAAERDEAQAMLDLYMSALGMLPLFEEPAASYSEAKGRGDAVGNTDAKLVATVATGMQTEIGRKALVTALDIMIEREESELTDNQESQAKASEDNGATGPAIGEPADCMAGEVSRVDAGRTASATSDDGRDGSERRAPNPHSQAIPFKPADTAEEVNLSSRTSSATHSDDIDLTIPAFLRRDEGRGYPKRESVEA